MTDYIKELEKLATINEMSREAIASYSPQYLRELKDFANHIIADADDVDVIRCATRARLRMSSVTVDRLAKECTQWKSIAIKLRRILNEVYQLPDDVLKLQAEVIRLRERVKVKQKVCNTKDRELLIAKAGGTIELSEKS